MCARIVLAHTRSAQKDGISSVRYPTMFWRFKTHLKNLAPGVPWPLKEGCFTSPGSTPNRLAFFPWQIRKVRIRRKHPKDDCRYFSSHQLIFLWLNHRKSMRKFYDVKMTCYTVACHSFPSQLLLDLSLFEFCCVWLTWFWGTGR